MSLAVSVLDGSVKIQVLRAVVLVLGCSLQGRAGGERAQSPSPNRPLPLSSSSWPGAGPKQGLRSRSPAKAGTKELSGAVGCCQTASVFA